MYIMRGNIENKMILFIVYNYIIYIYIFLILYNDNFFYLKNLYVIGWFKIIWLICL